MNKENEMKKKVIFLTGGTGAIGSRLISELLNDPDVYLRLLIRPTSQKTVQERLDEVLQFWEIDKTQVLDRISIIKGDITSENLGIEKSVYASLSKEVTHIIHCATDIKLLLPLKEAREYTLKGTARVVELAKECQQYGSFVRFNYLSTMEVAGDIKGKVPEEFISTKRKFLNTYEIAKAEAEEFIRSLSEEGLPITVYRPAMVVGDSQTGKAIKFQSFYNILEDFILAPKNPVVPYNPHWLIDIVPVDFVAKAIGCLYDAPQAQGNVYNIASGPVASMSLSDFMNKAQKTLESLTEKEIIPPKKVHPVVIYSILCLSYFFSRGKAKKMIAFNKLLTRYLFLEQVFENNKLLEGLEKKGVKLPSFKDYFPVICSYYLKKRNKK